MIAQRKATHSEKKIVQIQRGARDLENLNRMWERDSWKPYWENRCESYGIV